MQVFKNFSKNYPRSDLQVNPFFANLVEETENYYVFKIEFSLEQSTIVKNNLCKVDIKVYRYTEDFDKQITDGNTNEKNSSRSTKDDANKRNKSTTDRILTQGYEKSALSLAKLRSIVAQTTVGDLQTYVFADVNQIMSKNNPRQVPTLYKNISVLQSIDDIEKRNLFIGSNNINARKLTLDSLKRENLDLISKKLIDPAAAVGKKYENSNIDEVKQIRSFYLSQSATNEQETYYKLVQKQTYVNRVGLFGYVNIPKSFASGILDVEFEIYKLVPKGVQNVNPPEPGGFSFTEEEATLTEVVKKQFNITKQIKVKNIITDTPNVNAQSSRLTITQCAGEQVNSVIVTEKTVNNSGLCTNYTSPQQTKLSSGQNLQITINPFARQLKIFRASSCSEPSTVRSSFFNSVVVGDYLKIDASAMIIQDDPGASSSLNIQVKNCPSDVTQFRITRKNIVGGVIKNETMKIVSDFTDIDPGSVLVVRDDTVQNDFIYEYSLQYKTSLGTVFDSVKQIYKYTNYAATSTVVSLVTNTIIDSFSGEPRVQFTIQDQVKKGTANQLKDQLKKSDVFEEFKDDIKSISDKFDDLLIHKIVRVNLETGQREEFEEISKSSELNPQDVTSTLTFSDDVQTRQKYSISKLNSFSSYMYEIRTTVRSPLSLLRDYVKTVTIPFGKGTKTYSYRPYKWRQPSTLNNGTILAQDEDGNIISEISANESTGEIGVTGTYTVTGFTKFLKVNSLRAERVDRDSVLVTWSVEGNISEYDHFVVVKKVNGKKTLLGAVHSTDFVDNITVPQDFGTISYYVTPVFIDYSVGVVVKTNSLKVDPEEYLFFGQEFPPVPA